INLGESITFQARATDNTKVAGLQLLIDGTAVVLDSNGMATFTPTIAGTIIAKAYATDTNGNIGQAIFDVAVIDTSDVNAPDVSLDLGAYANGTVTRPVNIKGTVSDDNLDYYVLLVAPIGSSDFKEIFRGTSTVNNDVLGKFDPSLLENDSYTLRLEAHDKGGNVSFVEDTVNVSGELKLGNFRLSFTDLSIPVTGIPITLTRTYDSLKSDSTDDFGYGWRMEFRDTDLRTSVGKPTGEVAELGGQNPFKDGTKVYITLPGGKRKGFTFKPTIDPISQYLRGAGGVDSDPNLYHPSFVADAGVTDTLTVQNTRIIHGAGTNQYYGLGGSAYNPADTYYGGVYVLTTKEGIVYQIDAATGDLLTVTDTNGNTLTYTDADITSSTGQKITFGRDAQGRIATVTDPAGKVIRYDYNAQGDLVSVTDREGNTTRMEYDQERKHYLDKIIDPFGRTGVKNEYGDDGRLKYLEDVNGQKVEMSYDPNNSRQTVLDQLDHATIYEYDARGNVLTEIDALGQITKRTYDDNNNVLEETVISDRSGGNGFTTKYTYDSQNNKLTETDPLGNITYYTYGANSRLLTETDSLGRTTINTYSKSGNLRSTTDALGNTTGYDYDLRGQLRSVKDANGNLTTFDYDDNGNVTSVTDALGNVTAYTYNANGDKLTETRQMTTPTGLRTLLTTWTYDDNGRMKTMTDAENHTTTYEYDKLGHQTAVTDALNHRTEYKYDEKGQLIATIYADDTPDNPDDNLRSTSRYDQAGRTIATIDKAGRETRFVYDDVGRLIETINPDTTPNNWDDNPNTRTEYYSDGLVKAEIDERGDRTEFRYDADGRETVVIYADDTPAILTDNPRTTYTYDKTGQRIAETDALNHTTTYKYDDLGRLSKTGFQDKTYTTSEYDNLGRRIAMTDQSSKRTEYRYDVLGRLTGVKNALQDWTEYGYNEVGNLIWMEDANDRRTNYEYDGVGHRMAVILPIGQRSDTTYDAVGNLKTYTDFNRNTITYSYDPMNWMTYKQFQDGSKVTYTHTSYGLQDVIKFVDASGQTTATYDYDYDERDRLTKRTDPDGRKIEYTYDAASNRTSVTTASGTVYYTFDARNRLDQVIENSVVTADYEYDAVSNLVRTTLANGTQEIRSYDDLNRLKFLENHKGDTILSSYSYTLDKVGNRTKVVEHDGRTVDYTYDDLYRLTEEKITDAVNGDRVYDYIYDQVGNRKTKSENVNGATTVTNYAYDANDRLLNETVNQQIIANYTYDNNGNTLAKTENGITTEYTWDYENRLIAAIVKDASDAVQQQMQYRYNDNGIRVAATIDGVETRYLIDEMQPYAQVLEEYSSNGAVQVEYIYGNDLIAQEKGSDRTFYHVDGLGSTRVLTDSTGSVVSTYNYEAYGELISSTGGVENKYLFAGEQFDEALGDYYNRARYYDADTGRFTSRDTYEGELGNPLTLHKYIYTHDNPVNFTDPRGLFLEYSIGGLAAASLIEKVLVSILIVGTGVALGLGTYLGIQAFLDLYIPYFSSTDGDKASDILKEGAIPNPKVKKSEKSKEYNKLGDFDTANDEFDKVVEELGVDKSTVKDQGGGTRSAELPDGSRISVRNISNEGSPTIQVDPVGSKKHTKFRYK
ncbi:RHS repeat-associated core domain-containing protein, partial [Nostoc sp.]|uniref:RHS repeat-associated core domain-containing protein n=1 Tax=Nostoc sp. TaxID=1180 RepID=UPI002FF8E07D